MIYQKLLEMIETNEDKITKDLVAEFRKREETWHYRDLSEDVVYERVHQVLFNVYRRLANWLNKNTNKDTIFAYYTTLGSERFKEGIPLQETVMVLMLIKRKLYDYVMANRMLDSAYGLNQIMELNYHVVLFFDRIIHSTIVGYENEMKQAANK